MDNETPEEIGESYDPNELLVSCTRCGGRFEPKDTQTLKLRYLGDRIVEKIYCNDCVSAINAMRPIPLTRLELYRRETIKENWQQGKK